MSNHGPTATRPATRPGEGGLTLQDLTAHTLRVLLADGEGVAPAESDAPDDVSTASGPSP